MSRRTPATMALEKAKKPFELLRYDYDPEAHLHTVLQNREDDDHIDDSSLKTLSSDLATTTRSS